MPKVNRERLPKATMLLVAVDLLSGHGVLQLADPKSEKRSENRSEACLEPGREAQVLSQKNRSSEEEIGALHRGIRLTAEVAHAGVRHQQDFAGSAADLHRQIGVRAELSVTFVDLANGFDVENADQERGAPGIVHRERLVTHRLGGTPVPVRRKRTQLRGGMPFRIDEQG